MSDIKETVNHGIDGVAAVATVGVVAEVITPIAAIFTLIWTGLRIYILIENRIRTGKWKP